MTEQVSAGRAPVADVVFGDAFLETDADAIARDLADKGYFCCPAALRPEILQTIERDATRHRLSLNLNGIGGVHAERQYYLTHMLAVSKAFFEFCTHPKVFEVCRAVLGESFRLKSLRYYETYGGHRMQWHTDNKTDRGFAHIPGLIFIVYVSDVEDGEFQYVEGSHAWSGETAYSDYSDRFVEREHGSRIRSFRLPKGSLLIYNTYGIHRARPVEQRGFVRKSLFFQVDAEIDRSEPIIVNTEFLTSVDATLAMYLGFGKPSGYQVFPDTGLGTLRLDRQALGAIGRWLAYRTARPVLGALPQPVRRTLKRLAGRP